MWLAPPPSPAPCSASSHMACGSRVVPEGGSLPSTRSRAQERGSRPTTISPLPTYGGVCRRRQTAFGCTYASLSHVHSPISTDPRRSAFKICLQGAISSPCRALFRIVVAVGSNSFANCSGLLPARTNSTIWFRNSRSNATSTSCRLSPSRPMRPKPAKRATSGRKGGTHDHRSLQRCPRIGRSRPPVFGVDLTDVPAIRERTLTSPIEAR